MKFDIVTLGNKKAGSIDLDNAVFGVPVKSDILARTVNWQLAKRQSGNHKTKTISEISGSTAKPWRQKGTGRARQGSKRATQWRGGQTVFGPVVRSHGYSLNKKVRKLALRTALSSKHADGNLVIIDDAKVDEPKTSSLASKLNSLGVSSALIISGSKLDQNFVKAAANIPLVDVLPQQGANVYDILRRETLILTKEAVVNLVERLK
ncbi:MAG: 50S ribosomal protein L4 [Rhodospirillaceae bacterium]|nr:50S ribosomal protein L4 [Rhodospirillaceae bacterium]|tara:strand:- start:3615 stop:4235 length:621 start_codon:yes stop_codon:yes gene_type:complete